MSTVHLVFDPSDLEDCKRALDEIVGAVRLSHGRTQARLLLSEQIESKSNVKKSRNMALVAIHMGSGLSVKRTAWMLAGLNKLSRRNGRGQDYWHGPTGSTDPETLERQINRAKKRMAGDPDYSKAVEAIAKVFRAEYGTPVPALLEELKKQVAR